MKDDNKLCVSAFGPGQQVLARDAKSARVDQIEHEAMTYDSHHDSTSLHASLARCSLLTFTLICKCQTTRVILHQ